MECTLLTKSEIFTLLKTGGKSSVTRFLDTTFYVILIFHLCFNFNSVLIILYLWMTLIGKHFTICNWQPLLHAVHIFNICGSLKMPVVSGEACWHNKINCAVMWSKTCLYYFWTIDSFLCIRVRSSYMYQNMSLVVQ